MAEPHIISTLREKRAEVSGLIASLERRVAQHRADLIHVDAVLRLYAPDLDPASIAPKAVHRRNDWFKRGELARMVLDVLRVALVPLTVREIAVTVMQRQGLDPDDSRPFQLMSKLVNNALTRQTGDLVERLVDGTVATWRVRP